MVHLLCNSREQIFFPPPSVQLLWKQSVILDVGITRSFSKVKEGISMSQEWKVGRQMKLRIWQILGSPHCRSAFRTSKKEGGSLHSPDRLAQKISVPHSW